MDSTDERDASGPHRRLHLPAVRVPARVHPGTHLLFWQVRGRSVFVLGTDRLPLTAGRALWVPAGVRHELDVEADSVLLPLGFEVSRTATTLRAPTAVHVDSDLRILFLAYVQYETSIIRPTEDLGRRILAAIEEAGERDSDLPLPRRPAAREVARILRSDPGDDRGVDQLAADVHTSARSLQRAFLAETGLTLRQWRIRNRIEAAQALLRTDTALTAIAHRVGYTSVAAFHRVFRAQTGVTPLEYARGATEGPPGLHDAQ